MSVLDMIDVAVVVLAAGATLRLAIKPAVLREFRERPSVVIPAAVVIAALFMLFGWLALVYPAARHILALVLAVAMAAAWYRARPEFGRNRRYPPGSLGVGQSLDALTDKTWYLRKSREHGPIFKMSQFGKPTVCVLGLERGRTLLSQHATSLESAVLPYNSTIPDGFLRFMTPEVHKVVAPFFRQVFSAIPLSHVEPRVRENYRRALARISAASLASPAGVRPRPFFERPVFESLAQMFYGLEHDDARVDTMFGCMPALLMGRTYTPGWRREVEAGLDTMRHAMRDVQRGWTTDAGAGPPSVLRSMVAAMPDAVENATYTGNLALVNRVAFGDVTGLHDWVIKMCCDHGDWLAPVRTATTAPIETGRSEGTSNPATRFVMETLRHEQSETLYRRVAETFEFEDMVLPKGWIVRVLVQESHQNAEFFPEPARFDPDRFAPRSYPRTAYSPFGCDAHRCMGAHLAQFLATIFVEELVRGYEWRVVSDGPPERMNRHFNHWRPSSRFRVVLTPRATIANLQS
jgi:cytochrome P450